MYASHTHAYPSALGGSQGYGYGSPGNSRFGQQSLGYAAAGGGAGQPQSQPQMSLQSQAQYQKGSGGDPVGAQYGQSHQYGGQLQPSGYAAPFGGNSLYGGTQQQQIAAYQQQKQSQPQHQNQVENGGSGVQGQSQGQVHAQGQLVRQQSQSQLQRRPSQSGTNTQQVAQSQSQNQSQAQISSSEPPRQPPTTEDRTLFIPLQEISSTLREVADQDERAVVGSGTQGAGGLEGGIAGLNSSNNYSFPPMGANDEPFRKEKSIQLPQALFMKLQRTKQGRQGLLPDIQRAWFAIDGHLYLWDYGSDNNQRLDACEHSAEGTVDCVELVKADPTIFTSDIDYLLVVATRQHVVVLGLNYGPEENTVTLVDTGVKAANPTGQAFTQIAGTSSSRIFLCGGQDGCLYELGYNTRTWAITSWVGLGGSKDYLQNWTSSSGIGSMVPLSITRWLPGSGSSAGSLEDVMSIVVDSDRKCLYALTRGSAVHLYVYEARDQLRLVCTSKTLLAKARNDTMNNRFVDNTTKIVAIQVVGSEESSRLHLVAITNSGVRMYITHARSGYGGNSPPSVLEVVHTRLPMTSLPDAIRPFRIDAMDNTLPQSRYLSGVFVAVVGDSEKTSATYLFHSGDTMRSLRENALPESVQAPRITSSVLVSAVAEVPSALSSSSRIEAFNRSAGTGLELHELITEVTVASPRRFLILAQNGLETWSKAKPSEVFRRYIMSQDRNAFEQNVAKRFEGRPEQLCAILVAVLVTTKIESTADGKDAQLCATIGEIAIDYLIRTATSVPGGAASYNGITPRLRGLMLHISRIQRRFWKRPVTRLVASPNIQDLTMQPAVLRSIQQELLAIESVMLQRHIFFESSSSSAYPMYNRATGADEGSRKWEQLVKLVRQSIEAISFVLLLVENKLQVTVARSSPETQQQLLNMTYDALTSSAQGRQTARALVSTLMNQQLGQQISIETISDTLQNRCGSFCNADDVILYKAMESIRKAKSCRSVTDREAYLHEALQLYIRGSSSLTVEKVTAACEEFRQLNYPAGCVELPLECAQRRDTHNAAYHPSTEMGRTAAQARAEYYQVVLDTLGYYDERLDETHGTAGEQAALTGRSRIYEHALNVTDVLFCGRLYEWMLERGRDDELLQLENGTILEFLRKRKPVDDHRDLLWKYYARREEHLASALALSALVEGFDLPLNERVEYLAYAVSQAKSSALQANSAPVDFITELEEKAEVANIQLAIYAEVERGTRVDEMEKDDVLDRLGERFFTVTELYNEFAEPLGLYSAMLALYHASGHEDEEQAMVVWDNLIGEALDCPEEQKKANLSAVIVEMGRRFYPSPYAMPSEPVLTRIFATAYDIDFPAGNSGRLDESQVTEWTLRALVEGNVPLRDCWDVLVKVGTAGTPPFETAEGSLYVELLLRLLIRMWLDENDRQVTASGFGDGGGGRKDFAATAVDAHIEHWLIQNESDRDPRMMAIAESYREIREEVRRKFWRA